MTSMATNTIEVRINHNLLNLKWGDIVYVDFGNNGENKGSEQSGYRPAIVIQNDKGNNFAPTTIVACITSQYKKNLPTHVTIDPQQSGLDKVSVILMEQIRTIDKSRIKSKVGHINNNWIVEKIKKSLTISLNMI